MLIRVALEVCYLRNLWSPKQIISSLISVHFLLQLQTLARLYPSLPLIFFINTAGENGSCCLSVNSAMRFSCWIASWMCSAGESQEELNTCVWELKAHPLHPLEYMSSRVEAWKCSCMIQPGARSGLVESQSACVFSCSRIALIQLCI